MTLGAHVFPRFTNSLLEKVYKTFGIQNENVALEVDVLSVVRIVSMYCQS